MAPMSGSAPGRSYGGMSAEERRTARRAVLLEAGRDLWCEQGWAGVSMRGVCARTGLTDRYFYENFDDRDALLVAVAEGVRDEGLGLMLSALEPHLSDPLLVQLRAVLTAVIEFIATDPGGAQIFFGDHGGSEALEALRRKMIETVVGLFLDVMGPRLVDASMEFELRLTLQLGIGGFVEAASAWRAGDIPGTADEFLEMLMRVGVRLADGLLTLD